MALSDILGQLTADAGIKTSSPSERAYAVNLVNSVAKLMYDMNDLKQCEREQLFEFDQSQQQAALPIYVEKVIAARDYDIKLPMHQVDMRPRYMYQNWRQPFLNFPYYIWRMKGVSALCREISNAGKIKVSILAQATKLFSVTIIGSTISAARVTEKIQFSPDDAPNDGDFVSKWTENQFTSVDFINKQVQTDTDIYFFDIEGNQLSTMRNCDPKAEWKLVQIMDRNEVLYQKQLVEILYKHVFVPFVNDNDEFICGNMYDEAIYWKALSKYTSKLQGRGQDALAFDAKSEQIIIQIAKIKDGPLEKQIQFGQNRVYKRFSYLGSSLVTAPRWLYPSTYSNANRQI